MVFKNSVYQSLNSFRDSFKVADKSAVRWFPGHMNRGMKVMQQKLKNVDCIIEIHDARIPLSGRNPLFKDKISGLKPHVLVFNKVDLADPKFLNKSVEIVKQNDPNMEVLYTDCKNKKNNGLTEVIDVTRKLITSSNRYNRIGTDDLCAMIVGVPNVGKSSLINALRNKYLGKSKTISVGAEAGITRSVSNKIKVYENPLIYIYDSPGILTPSVGNIEVGMKLALCSTFKDTEVGYINIADYLLYWMNKHGHFTYTSYLNLKEPTDNITEALTVLAATYNLYIRIKEFDGSGGYSWKLNLEAAAYNFVTAFRKGTLGYYNLDFDNL